MLNEGIMSTMNISLSRRLWLQRDNEQTYTIERGQTLVLKANGQPLRVKAGVAWISCDGDDYILESGKRMTLTRGGDAWVIISGLGNAEVTIAVSEA